jgi:hypothetical protein
MPDFYLEKGENSILHSDESHLKTHPAPAQISQSHPAAGFRKYLLFPGCVYVSKWYGENVERRRRREGRATAVKRGSRNIKEQKELE